MAWTEFEQCVGRIAACLYRFDAVELARAEAALLRLQDLATHYQRLRREPSLGGGDSAAHLCRSPSPVRGPRD